MRFVSDKSCRENQNTVLYSGTVFKNRAIYNIGPLWEHVLETDRSPMTI